MLGLLDIAVTLESLDLLGLLESVVTQDFPENLDLLESQESLVTLDFPENLGIPEYLDLLEFRVIVEEADILDYPEFRVTLEPRDLPIPQGIRVIVELVGSVVTLDIVELVVTLDIVELVGSVGSVVTRVIVESRDIPDIPHQDEQFKCLIIMGDKI